MSMEEGSFWRSIIVFRVNSNGIISSTVHASELDNAMSWMKHELNEAKNRGFDEKVRAKVD